MIPIPHEATPIIDERTRKIATPWRRYFEQVASNRKSINSNAEIIAALQSAVTGISALISIIDSRVDGLEISDAAQNARSIGVHMLAEGGGGDGEQGPPGPAGRDGSAGSAGPAGAAGPAVFLLDDPEPGEQGPRGPAGDRGADGASGAQGSAGPALFFLTDAEAGEQGPPGQTGARGVDGAQGQQGAIGPALYFLLDQVEPEPAMPGPKGDKGDTGAPGGGGGSATVIERDLGSVPAWTGTFTITDAAISGTSKLIVWQTAGPYTGKGTLADEAEMDTLSCIAYPGAGSASVRWKVEQTVGARAPLPGGSPARAGVSALAPPQDDPQASAASRVLPRVRGNFKFAYQVL